MIKLIVALLAGLLFGAGLSISQMINPQKVINFLDVSGDWDPSLALVMGSALIISGLANWLRLRMKSPVLTEAFLLPSKTQIDGKLVTGNVLFGIGWGLVGLCPGPVLASFAQPSSELIYFFLAMLLGMSIAKKWAS